MPCRIQKAYLADSKFTVYLANKNNVLNFRASHNPRQGASKEISISGTASSEKATSAFEYRTLQIST